jgi:hypothetical protein
LTTKWNFGGGQRRNRPNSAGAIARQLGEIADNLSRLIPAYVKPHFRAIADMGIWGHVESGNCAVAKLWRNNR